MGAEGRGRCACASKRPRRRRWPFTARPHRLTCCATAERRSGKPRRWARRCCGCRSPATTGCRQAWGPAAPRGGEVTRRAMPASKAAANGGQALAAERQTHGCSAWQRWLTRIPPRVTSRQSTYRHCTSTRPGACSPVSSLKAGSLVEMPCCPQVEHLLTRQCRGGGASQHAGSQSERTLSCAATAPCHRTLAYPARRIITSSSSLVEEDYWEPAVPHAAPAVSAAHLGAAPARLAAVPLQWDDVCVMNGYCG